jgi:hypothetical protein
MAATPPRTDRPRPATPATTRVCPPQSRCPRRWGRLLVLGMTLTLVVTLGTRALADPDDGLPLDSLTFNSSEDSGQQTESETKPPSAGAALDTIDGGHEVTDAAGPPPNHEGEASLPAAVGDRTQSGPIPEQVAEAQDPLDRSKEDESRGTAAGCADGPCSQEPPTPRGGSLTGAAGAIATAAGVGAVTVAGAIIGGGPPGRGDPPSDDSSPDDDPWDWDSELNQQIDAVYERVADLKLDIEEALEAYRAAHADEPDAPPSMSPARRQELIAELGRIRADLERLAPSVEPNTSEQISLDGVRNELSWVTESLQPTQGLDQRIDQFERSLDFFDRQIRNLQGIEGPSQGQTAAAFHHALAGEIERMNQEVAPWLLEGLPQQERLAALTTRAQGTLGQLAELRPPAGTAEPPAAGPELPATEEPARAERLGPLDFYRELDEVAQEVEQAGGPEAYLLGILGQAYEEDVQARDRAGLQDTLNSIEFWENEGEFERWSDEYRRLQELKEKVREALRDLPEGNAMSMVDLDTNRPGHSQTPTLPDNPGLQPLTPKDRALVTSNRGYKPLTPKEWESITINPGFKAPTPQQQRAAAVSTVVGAGTVLGLALYHALSKYPAVQVLRVLDALLPAEVRQNLPGKVPGPTPG